MFKLTTLEQKAVHTRHTGTVAFDLVTLASFMEMYACMSKFQDSRPHTHDPYESEGERAGYEQSLEPTPENSVPMAAIVAASPAPGPPQARKPDLNLSFIVQPRCYNNLQQQKACRKACIPSALNPRPQSLPHRAEQRCSGGHSGGELQEHQARREAGPRRKGRNIHSAAQLHAGGDAEEADKGQICPHHRKWHILHGARQSCETRRPCKQALRRPLAPEPSNPGALEIYKAWG